ncbi:C-type lectin domain family 3 member A homolog [Argopecten irradians]|uniref:C-type lectin domain family 3 member A homolog n=1 Tax=Argopecten irradians TaxID=31199 RepID=UPI00371B448A
MYYIVVNYVVSLIEGMEGTSLQTITMKTIILFLTLCIASVKCQDVGRCGYIQASNQYQVLEINNRCYHMVQDSVTWEQAASRCNSRNGTLAIIRDDATNNQLIQRAMSLDANDMANVSFYWIGGRVQTPGAAITWQRDINGAEVTNMYTAYVDDEPLGSGTTGCLILDPASMGWATDFCTVTLELAGYVCELASGSMSNLRTGASKVLLTFLLTLVLGYLV